MSGNYYTLAIGKQTAKGTPQASPTFKLKVTGGDINPTRQVIQLNETDSSRQEGKSIVVGAAVEGNPEFYCRPDDFGLLAYGVLGTNVDSGTAPNYIHRATMINSGATPYFTIFKAIGGSVLVDRYSDCRINGVHLKGQAGQALTCGVDILGSNFLLGQTDPALGPVTQDPLTYPLLTCTKGTSKPGTVESFELDITNGATNQMADSGLTPYDTVNGEIQVGGTMTMLFESDADYRRFHTGSATGTVPTTTLFTEALRFRIVATEPILMLDITLNSVAYTSYPVPPDPGGAPIKVAMGFKAMPDTTLSNFLQIETRNTVASY